MTPQVSTALEAYRPAQYWEERARQFAVEGNGLAAVCAYGMPAFYNWAIHLEQHAALAPWFALPPRARVLDVGCGIGRWSRLLAKSGASVTGIDLSPTMIEQARIRAIDDNVAERCRFFVQDLSRLAVGEHYDLVLGVTVLQHILDPLLFHDALAALTSHLAPGGRLVLLEAAPRRENRRCNSTVFAARPREAYLSVFKSCDLEVEALTGVDPAPFRVLLLPHLKTLPRPLATVLTWLATALSLPINLLVGRRAHRRSWHVVFVLRKRGSKESIGGTP